MRRQVEWQGLAELGSPSFIVNFEFKCRLDLGRCNFGRRFYFARTGAAAFKDFFATISANL